MGELRYAVLGTLEVRAGRDAVVLSGVRQRLVLAVLLLSANRHVEPDVLIEACWGDDLPADPDAALRTQVFRLRRALGAAGEQPLRTSGSGYVLEVPDAALDAARFLALLERSRSLAADAPERALAAVDEGLGLWRGPPFADVPDRGPVAEAARALDEQRVTALEERAALLVATGRDDDAVAALQGLVAEAPLRERPVALLVECLYRSGRQADALAAYQRHRRLLAEELGIHPSPMLRELERRVLRHELTPLPTPASRRRPLGLPPSSFVGREGDLQALRTLLERSRLVTLVGPGGVGKTRLARHLTVALAEAYPDGTWFCELSDVSSDDEVASRLNAVLGVEERAGVTPLARAVDFLGPMRALVVLDNCEQVLGGAAAALSELLFQTAAVDAVATSRQRLAIDGEHLWQVAPLSLPPDAAHDAPAIQLFVDRASAVVPGFTLGPGDLRVVAGICRRVDGLPLGIELAAASLRLRSLSEIAAGLDEGLLPTGGGPRTPPRHGSLEAVVDWSYRLLAPGEQRALASLAVFATGFTMEAARAVLGASSDGDPSELVASLLDRSLLVRIGTSPASRYGMLETVRKYARRRLLESGREGEVLAHHTDYLVRLAERAGSGLQGADEAAWVSSMAAEVEELAAVLRRLLDAGDLDAAARLVVGVYWFALWRAHSGVLAMAGQVVERSKGQRHRLLPLVHAMASVGAWQRGDLAAAERLVEAGLALLEPGAPGEVQLRESHSDIALFRGDLSAAVRGYERAALLARRDGDDLRLAVVLATQALAHAYAGDGDPAVARADEALAVAEAAGNPSATAYAVYAAGEVRLASDPEAALPLFERSLALAEEVDARFIFGVAGVSAATLHARAGDGDRALDLYVGLLDHWRRAGVWTQQWTTVRTLTELLTDRGEAGTAAALLGALHATTTAAPVFGADAERMSAVDRRLRRELGDAAYLAERERGAALGDDGAVALAMGVVRRLR